MIPIEDPYSLDPEPACNRLKFRNARIAVVVQGVLNHLLCLGLRAKEGFGFGVRASIMETERTPRV